MNQDRPPEPTLARLSFWVPPDRSSEFEVIYATRLAPILKKHGLVESSERSRPIPEGVFSRLFEVEIPAAVAAKEGTLQEDSAWREVLQSVGATFRTTSPDGLLQYRLGIYRAPAGPGKQVPTEAWRGHWRTYDATDGFSCGIVRTILQDREGALWIGSYGGGVSRFDGHRFTLFTPQDGLVSNRVNAMLFDREEVLWIGTVSGVSRFDGQTWATFTTQDGLASNKVHSMFQDRDGALWFGTAGGGLSRYDGATWTTFTTKDGLASNYVQSVFQDQEGVFWFGTAGGGVSRYDGQSWTTFTTKDGLASNEVWAILQDREGLFWFATGSWETEEGGLTRYDGQRWSIFTTKDGLPSNKIWSMLQDREGFLWVGIKSWVGTKGGVSRYDGATWTTFTTADGLAANSVEAMFQDREGSLWFGTAGGGLSRYEGATWTTFTAQDDLASNKVGLIVQDREGALWFSTWGGGVSRYDGWAWTTFTAQDGLANNHGHSMLQDREGALWFGTAGGVSRYDGQSWATFTSVDVPLGEGMSDILQDQEGALWFSTLGAGVSRYDGQTWATFTTQDGLANNSVGVIFQDRAKDFWFSTAGGVSRYDGQRWTTFTMADVPLGEGIYPILQDRDGALWFSTAGAGVNRYDGQTWTTFTIADGLASNYTTHPMIQDRDGTLWVGTQGGLSRYDGEKWTTFTTADGLTNDWVRMILQDREGLLWVGTWGSGVSCYDGKRWRTFTAQDGLAGNSVGMILQDREGRLWFGTEGGGVSCYDGQVFQTLTAEDGLASNGAGAIFEDREGYFWFCTSGGVTRYRPPVPSSPPVFIDAVVADRRYERGAEVELPVGARLIAFEFHGISFRTRPEAMVYRYRLVGRDDAWQTTHTRRVEYQDLPVGEYTFQVRAVDRDLNYSDPAAVLVRVAPDPRLEALTQALSGGADRFVGRSPALQHVQAQLAQVAPTDLTVMILGETGTGKGLAARTLHQLSQRRSGPFLQVNCGGIPPGLLESELFGHERGAFTGAVARKLGKVELAHGGTLFLDEIGDLPVEGQVKLLRLLEERTFERVGGTQTLSARVRVIAATNRDLAGMVAAGQFRQDLYFRLEGFTVWLPPLRQRREDIPELALFFAGRMAAHLDKRIEGFEPAALALLQEYPWPGNIRELEHTVQRAVIVAVGPRLRAVDLILRVEPEGPLEEFGLPPEEYERRYLARVLAQTGWVIKGPRGAAARLGTSPSTLNDRLRKLGIVRSEGR